MSGSGAPSRRNSSARSRPAGRGTPTDEAAATDEAIATGSDATASSADEADATASSADEADATASSADEATAATPAATAELTARTLAAMLDAGLAAAGVASAGVFERTRHDLLERKAAGLSAGMAFTYRNPWRSTDPSQTVDAARSLVVGAYGYLRTPPEPLSTPHRARVARYAWADHYTPLATALRAGAGVLKEAGYRAVVVADSNALVDREAAQRAGLGWYGRNANLLLPGRGSWFILGSVVTDAELIPSPPATGSCGSCTRCLPACPTGAIVEPGVIDARRCLAWLLQATGPFPRQFRVALGDRIYGCDECQEVCPPNITAARHPTPVAEPVARPAVDPLDLLDPDDDHVIRTAGRWYIPERDARYLRRNALIVLGNAGDPGDERAVAALRRCLADGDPLIRAHAVWAAARLGRAELVEELLPTDADPMVQEELDRRADVPVRAHVPRRA
jgi:epoxyqueuosine reductase